MLSFIAGLTVEGLWRGGCNSSALDELKCRLNKDACAEIESSFDVSAVALLLLVWLGDLPQPLLPQQATSDLISIMKSACDPFISYPILFFLLSVSNTSLEKESKYYTHSLINIHHIAFRKESSMSTYIHLALLCYYLTRTKYLLSYLSLGVHGWFNSLLCLSFLKYSNGLQAPPPTGNGTNVNDAHVLLSVIKIYNRQKHI